MSPLNRGPLMTPRPPPPNNMRPPRFSRMPPPRHGPILGLGPGAPPMRMPPPRHGPILGPGPGAPPMRMPPPRHGPILGPGPGAPPMHGPMLRGPMPMMMRGMMMRGVPPRGVPPHFARPRFPPNTVHSKGKNTAKKGQKLEELELKKPWMTDEIRVEIGKKNKLYAKAKKNKDAKEWEEFKDLRNKVTRMIRDAKNEYLAKHPEQAHMYENDELFIEINDINELISESDDEPMIDYYCESCDREFGTPEKLDQHLLEHEICNIDGCTFSAHAKIVQKHITMQHTSGLYNRMKTITTEEDIEKWILERKKRYPTAIRAKAQEAERVEKEERGEIVENLKQKRKRKQVKQPKRKRKRTKNWRSCNINEGTDQICQSKLYRGLIPFAGTSFLENASQCSVLDDLQNDVGVEEIKTEQEFQVSDEEEVIPCVLSKEQNNMEVKNFNSTAALTALSLVADYDSSSENDNEPPEEIPIKKMRSKENNDEKDTKSPNLNKTLSDSAKTVVCEKNKHASDNCACKRSKDNRLQPTKQLEKLNKVSPNEYSGKKLRLLNKLLALDIRHERNVICQCINYISKNNYFD